LPFVLTSIDVSFTARLVGGNSTREGRLEIYHDYIWGTVCDDGFNDAAARVVCRSLGFGYVYNPVILYFPQCIDFVFFGMHRVIIKEENANTIGLYFKKYVTKTFNVRHETVTRALTYMSCIIVHYFCIAKIVNYTP